MNKTRNVLKYRSVALYFLFSSIIALFLGSLTNSLVLTIMGSTLLIIYILISLVFWRCPFCKIRLPMRFNIKDVDEVICPYCNTNLLYNEEKKQP